MAPHPGTYGQHKLDWIGFFFFKDKLGWGEGDVGGVAVNNNQNTLYENSKDIILIMKI